MNRRAQAAEPSARADAAGSSSQPPGSTGLEAALAAARGGDSEAFRVLFRDTQPRLLRYLRALIGADAEDVASESWLQVVRDLHGFAGDVDGFRGWVVTIGRNRAIDHLRWTARRPPSTTPQQVEELTELAAADDTATTALDAVSTDAAVRLIATLPADQAEAVLLRVVVGLDPAAAAKVLGKRPGAVRTAAYRGLRNLAKRLDQAGSQGPAEIPATAISAGAAAADPHAAQLQSMLTRLPRGRPEE